MRISCQEVILLSETLEMSLLICTSFILHLGHCQGRVPDVIYAWWGSPVTLECRTNTQEEIKQITWEIIRGGTSTTFLTHRSDTGPIYLKEYGRRVRFKGDGNKDGSIEIFNVTLEDDGVFKCVFTTFPSGNTEKTIQLEVFVLPTVTRELIEDVRTPCLNMVVECLASSAKPPAEIQWITNGINYTTKEDNITHSNGTVSTRSQLYMTSTPDLYGHTILCLAYQPNILSHLQENVTTNVTLTNIQFPPQMVQIEVLKNDDNNVLQLSCKSEANPRPNYYWKRGDANESKAFSSDVFQVTSPTLNFTGGEEDGLYICESSNALGLNRGYIYMHTSKSSSRCHLAVFLSVVTVMCIASLSACYLFKERLLDIEYLPCSTKNGSAEDIPEEQHKGNQSNERSGSSIQELGVPEDMVLEAYGKVNRS